MRVTLFVLTTLAMIGLAVTLSRAAHNWWIGGILLGAYAAARVYDWRRYKRTKQ